MREKYESLQLAQLKELAKARGLKGISVMRKADLIELMLAEDEKQAQAAQKESVSSTEAPAAARKKKTVHSKTAGKRSDSPKAAGRQSEDREAADKQPENSNAEMKQPENSKADAKQQADTETDSRQPESSGTDGKQPENSEGNGRRAESPKTENRRPLNTRTGRRKPEQDSLPVQQNNSEKNRGQDLGVNSRTVIKVNNREPYPGRDSRITYVRNESQNPSRVENGGSRYEAPRSDSYGRSVYNGNYGSNAGYNNNSGYGRSSIYTKRQENYIRVNENRSNYNAYNTGTGNAGGYNGNNSSYNSSNSSYNNNINSYNSSYNSNNSSYNGAESREGQASETGNEGSGRSESRSSEYRQTENRMAESRPAENRMTENRMAENRMTENRPMGQEAAPGRGIRTTQEIYDEAQFPKELDSGQEAYGILEVMGDGYGFIRCENFLPGDNDVYVAPSQIRRFGLKTGDILRGNKKIKTQQEKFSALLFIRSVNGFSVEDTMKRANFEDMTPIFPNERIRLETPGCSIAMRAMDLVCPVGKGQRGMIVSPPKAGKTTLLKEVASSILSGSPDMHMLILLIDERPEEVTDIKEAIHGKNVEVIYSTFDEQPEHHKRVAEMVIERAKRLVEHRQDVVILLDSITRLTRAYNLIVPPSGRTLSGGLDPAALHMPKRFFGAARNMRQGGSLTILATALVDTGSKMDDVVYEEFKGTGNMEMVLDRRLSERRIFPAIDLQKSGTRREDLLLEPEELEAINIMRRALNGLKPDEATDRILDLFTHTKNNRDFVNLVKKNRFI